MEFADVVRRRRMVRRYDPDRAVDPEVLDRMLANATKAPSAGFSQGWAFLRLETREDVARFWRSTSPDPDADNAWLDGMRTAPVVIVPLANKQAYLDRYSEPDKRGPDFAVPWWYTDTAMATLLILQTAVDEGLGACFFGVPGGQHAAFRAEFGIPEDYRPLGAITIGHRLPDTGAPGSAVRRARKPVADVVHRGHWQA